MKINSAPVLPPVNDCRAHCKAESGVFLQDLIEEFLAWQGGVRGLSPHSISAYRNDLESMKTMLIRLNASAEKTSAEPALASVTSENLRACIGMLSRENRAASSINRFSASVRNFFAYCRRFQYIKIDPAADLKNVKMPVRVPKFMNAAEIDEMCAQPSKAPLLWEARDRALFEALYSSGCRVSELAELKMSDLSVRLDSALVRGKGGKDRRVFFSKEAVRALKIYTAEREQRLIERGEQTYKSALTLFINRNGKNLSARGIRFIVSRYSSLEGTKRHVSPHTFRHTFATAMIRSGADIRSVQEMLGHASLSTTQRYTHITSAELKALYNRAHPHGSKNGASSGNAGGTGQAGNKTETKQGNERNR